MSVIDLSQISRQQYQFLTDGHRHVGYGGARGGGKSWAVRTKAKMLAAAYDGIKILIVRRTFPELLNNHINPLRDELNGVARYNKSEKVFTFPNGSTIKFGYCATDSDLDQYQGAEYDVIFLDEATQLQEMWIKKINACVRGVNRFPKRTYYTCNPGGASHGYIKRLFVDKVYERDENPEDYSFIQAKVTDNKALMASQPDYINQLKSLPPKLRAAWLDGKWDVYEGQFFEDFVDRPEHYLDRKWTHVIEPFEIPDGWKIYRSFDWGYNKPFSCGWWAVDYDGVVYRILELYGCRETPNEGVKWTPTQVCAEIHRIETEHRWLAGRNIHGIADPAIWDAETGESIAQTAAKNRVYFSPGDHKRLPGWMQMHYRLAFDGNGYPMMYIFKNCKAFIRTIPLLQYDDHKVEDLDTSGEDHVADETRYFLMSRPISPRKVLPRDPYNESPAKLFLDIDKKDIISRPHKRIEIIEE
ncbi:MAG: phage terminase large subunit [Faecousia sp.]